MGRAEHRPPEQGLELERGTFEDVIGLGFSEQRVRFHGSWRSIRTGAEDGTVRRRQNSQACKGEEVTSPSGNFWA